MWKDGSFFHCVSTFTREVSLNNKKHFEKVLLQQLNNPDEVFAKYPSPSLRTVCAIICGTRMPDLVSLTVLSLELLALAKRLGVSRYTWLKNNLRYLEERIEGFSSSTEESLEPFPESIIKLLDTVHGPDDWIAFRFICVLLQESRIPDKKIRPVMEALRKNAKRLNISGEDLDLTLEMLHCSTQAHKKHLNEYVKDAGVAARRATGRALLARPFKR